MNLPAHIRSLPAYSPGESIEALAARLGRPFNTIIKLDANENPFGAPPAVYKALAGLTGTNRYPDSEQRNLRSALEAYTGVSAEYLIAGNGSDELLGLTAQVLLSPGDAALVCPPTFSMYAFYASLHNGRVISVPRLPDFALDMPGILAAAGKYSPKIIFLDHPGNPGGTLIPFKDIQKLLELPALIVIDEAYIEFSGVASLIDQVPNHENLVVTRTFSKWAGLAGFRVGYGAFPKWLGNALWRAKSPYNLTVPASTAAVAAMSDIESLNDSVERIRAERDRLAAALQGFPGLKVLPSATNFLLVQVGPAFGKTAAETCALLKERGILVRLFEALNSLRISIGLPDENQTLLQALRTL